MSTFLQICLFFALFCVNDVDAFKNLIKKAKKAKIGKKLKKGAVKAGKFAYKHKDKILTGVEMVAAAKGVDVSGVTGLVKGDLSRYTNGGAGQEEFEMSEGMPPMAPNMMMPGMDMGGLRGGFVAPSPNNNAVFNFDFNISADSISDVLGLLPELKKFTSFGAESEPETEAGEFEFDEDDQDDDSSSSDDDDNSIFSKGMDLFNKGKDAYDMYKENEDDIMEGLNTAKAYGSKAKDYLKNSKAGKKASKYAKDAKKSYNKYSTKAKKSAKKNYSKYSTMAKASYSKGKKIAKKNYNNSKSSMKRYASSKRR